MNDPADIPRPELAQAHIRVRCVTVPQSDADVAHRLDEAITPASVDRFEEGVDLGSSPSLGRGEDLAARVGQREQPMLAMVRADPALPQVRA